MPGDFAVDENRAGALQVIDPLPEADGLLLYGQRGIGHVLLRKRAQDLGICGGIGYGQVLIDCVV